MSVAPPGKPPRRGLRGWLKARRSRADQPRTYRIANSIRVPWGVGLSSLLLLGLAGALLIGRGGDERDVSDAVLDFQEAVTVEIAQSVRRAVNEGVDDIATLAVAVGALSTPGGEQLEEVLFAFADLHGRYRAVYVLDGRNAVVAAVGADPHPDALDPPPPYAERGLQDATKAGDDVALVAEYAPVFSPSGEPTGLTVVGEYDPAFLRFALEAATPGDAYVTTSDVRAVGTPSGTGLLDDLPRRELRDRAARASAGAVGVDVIGGSIENREIVGYAPVSGIGPAGQLGWGVVTTRTVASIPSPGTEARRQGLLFGLLVMILVITVFSWLYLLVIRPMLELQHEAERIAFGDLAEPVKIERYDEIGLVARALERIRILMIRKGAGSKGGTRVRRGPGGS